MEFAIALLIGFLAFYFGLDLFWRIQLFPPLESLRQGRIHYLLLGVLLGMFFPEEDLLFRFFEEFRYSLIGILLVWVGFQAGLDLDLQRFRTTPASETVSQTIQVLIGFLLVFLMVLLATPILKRHLGLQENTALVAALLACFVLPIRAPEPVFRWRSKTFSPPRDTAIKHAPGNALSLILVGGVFALFTPVHGVQFGTFLFGRGPGVLLLMVGLGLLMGVAFDFIFRAHPNGVVSMLLSGGMMAVLGSPCTGLKIPGLFVGFLGGMWLINTTVRKREVLELADRTHAFVCPVFYILLGSVIGGYGGGPFFQIAPLVPFGVALFLVRGLVRMLSLTIANRIWGPSYPRRSILEISGLPMNYLSVAIAVQGLYLGLGLTHNTLIAGALVAVFLSQACLFPPGRKKPPGHRPLPTAPTQT